MAGERKVLITGASGFIGKELCRALVEGGYQVTAVVRSAQNLPVAGVHYIVQDLEKSFDGSSLTEGMDTIVHLAGKAHGKRGSSEQGPEAFERGNVIPTRRLADAAVAGGVHHFIYLSSIGVHGDSTQDDPITETSAARPHADYARSKLRAEEVLKDSVSGTQTTFSIIRPTLVYGYNAPGNFGKLVSVCRRAVPLPFGRVENRRSLVSLGSLVHLIILCIERSEAENQVFVAADERPVSTAEIVRCLRSGMGLKPALVPVPATWLRVGFRLIGKQSLYQQLFGDLEVDATKAAKLLGWKRETGTSELLHLIGEKAV